MVTLTVIYRNMYKKLITVYKPNSDKRWSGFIIVNTVKDPLIFKDPWLWVTGFSLGCLHMGGQSVNGGGRLMRGDIDLMEGT